MTGCTSRLRCMACMFELHVETLECGKGFHRTCLNVCVTDCANRAGCIAELLSMAAGAGLMIGFPWQGGPRSVGFSSMAEQARQTRVLGIIVFEFRVVRTLPAERRCRGQDYNQCAKHSVEVTDHGDFTITSLWLAGAGLVPNTMWHFTQTNLSFDFLWSIS